MHCIVAFALLFQGSLSIHVRDPPKNEFPTEEFKSPLEKKEAAIRTFQDDVMQYAKERASPLGCKEMWVVDNLDMAAFAGGWHMAFHQPTIFENGYNSKCTRSDFTLKDGLTNGYEFEMFAQATNTMNSEIMSITLCGKNNDGKLAIGMCDSDPLGDNFWIIHYEEGADGFFLAVGGEPIIPVMQADGSIKCFHLQIGPMQQSGGIFIMTRADTPSEATIDRAKAAVSDAGLIWDNVLSATNHDDCSYKTPTLA